MASLRGRGRFLPRNRSDALLPAGMRIAEIAQLDRWNTPLDV
jgi:hypothetical protein